MNSLFGIGLSGLDFTGSKSVDVTITPSDWSSNTCTKSVSGMTPQLAVVCSPSVSSRQSWDLCKVRCISQNTDQLTFSCVTVPNVNVTANIMMINTLRDDLVSMSIQGDVTNPQFIYDPVDDTGLLYQITRYSGSVENVLPDSISPVNWEGTVGTQTLTAHYHEYDKYVSATKNITVLKKAVSLTVNGNWTNTQWCCTEPDVTGLSFTVNYNDGTSDTVSATLTSPSEWSTTVGSQDAIFSYTENGVTVTGVKSATVYRKVTSLTVNGDWTNDQIINTTPDTTGLTFTAGYNNGTSDTVNATVSPSTWSAVGTQTATFSYTERGYTVTATKSANVYNILSSISITTQPTTRTYNHNTNFDPTGAVVTASWVDGSTSDVSSEVNWSPTVLSTVGTQTMTVSYTYRGVTETDTTTVTVNKIPASLSVSGSWTNTQWTNIEPDVAGLTFTCTYSDNTSGSVTPSVSPSTWSSTVGTQTATFSYIESGVTVTTTKDASVVRKLSSLTINGSWTDNQWTTLAPTTTGLSYTANYNNGTSQSVNATLSSPSTWSSTVGTQTATFSYTESGVTVTTTKDANVVRKLTSLSVSGSWSNSQYEGQAPDTTGLTFTVSYFDGTSDSKTASQLTISPSTWATGSGSQTATFSYTESGITVSTTKTCNMTYNVTVQSSDTNKGTVSGSTTYIYSTSSQTESISYSAKSGYKFSSWSVSGGSASASGTTLTINANSRGNITVTGYFVAKLPSGAKRVGGVIFYIASSSNTYTFYDSNGDVVSAPSVGSDYTDYYYTKSGSSSDKFYVYYSTLVASKYWGYYEIATAAYEDYIGAGKYNTSRVLTYTDTSSYASGSIWEYIRNMRTNKTNGCDDWFIGCKAEYDQLRSSGTTGAGWFNSGGLWTSIEDSSTYAWSWGRIQGKWMSRSKSLKSAVAPLRAF